MLSQGRQHAFHIYVPEPSVTVPALPDTEHDRREVRFKRCPADSVKNQGLPHGKGGVNRRDTKEGKRSCGKFEDRFWPIT